MIEVYLIKGNNIQKIATIDYVNTNYSHCYEIVLSIGKTIYLNGTMFTKVEDSEYPICYMVENNPKYKIGAKDIKE